MKIALAQINTTVGDFKGNAATICQNIAWAHSEGADLVVFPEMAITGYPPRDLLELPSFVERNLEALDQVVAAAKDIGVVVGYVEPHPGEMGRAIYNSAAFIADGRLIGSQPKTLLPTYDVFDESRHFEAAKSQEVFSFRGKKIGLSICEDCWYSYELVHGRRLYQANPMQALKDSGAQLVICISASPFAVGKSDVRIDHLQKAAQEHGYPIIYLNQVGGNDQLVFDGHSMVINGQGKLVWEAPRFAEDRAVISTEIFSAPEVSSPVSEPTKQVYQALILGLSDYMRKCGFEQVVLGLSGGIDSAVVAALATAALGPQNVHAVAMPSPFSTPESVTDAEEVSRNLGINLQKISIAEIYQSFRDELGSGRHVNDPDLAEENIQARIRGTILMTLSNRTGAMVLSTGNKSELAVGYCTLYGDMTGGLALISDVPKTSVYELARFINRSSPLIPESIISKEPSAELRPNQTDQDSLPPYETLDVILKAYIEKHQSIEEIVALGVERGVVEDVIGKVNRNEYKRAQAPPGIKVTAKAFGMGRRFPIVNKF